MTLSEQEAYRKLLEELKWHKGQGEVNLIICNEKIIPYIPRKFKSCVLINAPSITMETNDTPPAATTIESHSQHADNHDNTFTVQDIVAENITHSWNNFKKNSGKE